MGCKIQVVSFQMPLPADYGGVIDVYYKLKALKQAGAYIILHTFVYGREQDDRIREVVDEVYFYKRRNFLIANISTHPYIANSRNDRKLVKRIISIGSPVILEGLHTCSIIEELKANGIKVGVRMHNVEHNYYKGLTKSTCNLFRKLFYAIESVRLKSFESILGNADAIFPICQADTTYFNNKFPGKNVKCVYPFYNELRSQTKCDQYISPYVLYHGNLNVEENSQAVEFILEKVLPNFNDDIKLIIAGSCNSKRIMDKMTRLGVEFVNHPNDAELDSLVSNAKVNLLISFQSTGVKLKLLKALSLGNGQCVINSCMASDIQLREFCHVFDNENDIAAFINSAFKSPSSISEIKKRRDEFNRRFDNMLGAKIILENIAY